MTHVVPVGAHAPHSGARIRDARPRSRSHPRSTPRPPPRQHARRQQSHAAARARHDLRRSRRRRRADLAENAHAGRHRAALLRPGRSAVAPGRRAVAHVVRRDGRITGATATSGCAASISRASTSRSTAFRSTIRKIRCCTSPTFPISRTACNSVQVQRGVGTSSNGTAAYAGSINMETIPLASTARGGQVQLEGGSFGSKRVERRVSRPDCCRATSRCTRACRRCRPTAIATTRASKGRSLFFSGGYFGDRDIAQAHRRRPARCATRWRISPSPSRDLDTDRRINPLTPRERDGFSERLAALVVHASARPVVVDLDDARIASRRAATTMCSSTRSTTSISSSSGTA